MSTDNNKIEMPVILVSPQGNNAPATVSILEWSPRQRTIRAFKALGICWGLALFCVFIPVLHFILVPLFFLGGPIAAYVLYRREKTLLGGQGQCPNCQQPFSVAPGTLSWPYKDLCTGCQTIITVEPKKGLA